MYVLYHGVYVLYHGVYGVYMVVGFVYEVFAGEDRGSCMSCIMAFMTCML